MKEWTLTAILTGDGGFSDIPEGRCFLDDADEELSERRRDLLLSDVLRISVKKKKTLSANKQEVGVKQRWWRALVSLFNKSHPQLMAAFFMIAQTFRVKVELQWSVWMVCGAARTSFRQEHLYAESFKDAAEADFTSYSDSSWKIG